MHPDQEQPRSMTPFFVIWTGQAFSLLGSQLVQFALVWWLTKTTGSATVLAIGSMMGILPQVLLSPFAGALVDRWNRRYVMMIADGAIALATVALAALYALDLTQIWHIYLLMFVRSLGGAFHWPAMQASTTLMVPQKHFSRIAGLNQALFGATNIIAPPLGALLLEIMPMQGVLAIDVVTALLAIAPLFFVHVPQPERQEATNPSVLADMREGLAFVWDWLGLRLVLMIAALINMLASPAFSLLPIMVTEHFKGGALELAWLQSASGIGVVLGGVALGIWGGFERRVVTAMSALALMGIGVILVGLTPASAFPLALAAFFLFGFMNPIVNGSLMAAMQSTVPPTMQGRVFTLISSGSAAMSPVGLAIAGPVADTVGVQAWFLMAGVTMLGMGATSFSIPAIMSIEDRAITTELSQPTIVEADTMLDLT